MRDCTRATAGLGSITSLTRARLGVEIADHHLEQRIAVEPRIIEIGLLVGRFLFRHQAARLQVEFVEDLAERGRIG